MSEENIDVMRRLVDVWNRRDLDGMLALADPEIEIHSTFAAIGGAVYHGHAGVHRWLEELWQIFPEALHVAPEAYFDLGDSVLVYLMLSGRGAQSGADVRAPIAQLHKFRDGLDIFLKSYVDRSEALRELGVTEGELDRFEP